MRACALVRLRSVRHLSAARARTALDVARRRILRRRYRFDQIAARRTDAGLAVRFLRAVGYSAKRVYRRNNRFIQTHNRFLSS